MARLNSRIEKVKSDLSLYRYRKYRIEILEKSLEDIEEMKSRGIKSTSQSSIVSNSSGDKIGNELAKYESMKNKVLDELFYQLQKTALVDIALKSLDDLDSAIIFKKYIEKKKIQDVESEVGYERSTIYRREMQALEHISNIINNENIAQQYV